MLDGRQACLWTALPGIIESVDLSAMTCVVQAAIQAPINDENGDTTFVNLPLLLDVPIVFPSAGGFTITFPLAAGDEVLVVFGSRAIDAWWQSGGTQKPVESRMHDLSDAFAIPGPKSQANLVSGISSSKLQIRNDAGTVYLSVGTKFALKNAVTDLKTVLSTLTLALETFSAGLNPVNLAAQAAALNTALTAIIDPLISALLEAS